MKIRTDFVTNSSSSGFVTITIDLVSGRLSHTFDYDSGYGAYTWSGNDEMTYDMEFNFARNGEDILRILEHCIEYFNESITFGASGEAFKANIRKINDISKVEKIYIYEHTRYDDGDEKEFDYSYSFKKRSLPKFDSPNEVKPSFNVNCCLYGDFQLGNEDGDYSNVIEGLPAGWNYSLFLNQIYRTYALQLYVDVDYEYQVFVIGDVTAREIEKVGFEKYAVDDEVIKLILWLQHKYKFKILKESDLIALGEPVIPWDKCPTLDHESKIIIAPCGEGANQEEPIFDYAFNCGLLVSEDANHADIFVVSGDNNEILPEGVPLDAPIRYLNPVQKARYFWKKRKGTKPLIVSEQDFIDTTSELRKNGRPVRPLDCRNKQFVIAGLVGKEKTAAIEIVTENGGTFIESNSANLKTANVLLYKQLNSKIRNAEKRLVRGEDIYLLTVEELKKAISMFNELSEGDKEQYKSKPVEQKKTEPEQIKTGVLSGYVCCLTGDFAFGKKSAVEKYIVTLGGSCTSSVTQKTNMLIIGELGSDNYAHGSYGTKYIRAKAMQDSGLDMTILSEKEFFQRYHE